MVSATEFGCTPGSQGGNGGWSIGRTKPPGCCTGFRTAFGKWSWVTYAGLADCTPGLGSVIPLTGDGMSNATPGVFHVTLAARDHVTMEVHHRLAGRFTTVHADVVPVR